MERLKPKTGKRLEVGIGLMAASALGQSIPQWNVTADDRIEQHRKGDLKILVMDGAGNPLPGVDVEVRMRKHAFKFGTAIGAKILSKTRSLPTKKNYWIKS